MKILAITGSRADYGPLKIVVDALKADPYFEVMELNIWGCDFSSSFDQVSYELNEVHYDLILVLGDRFEILAAATAAHLNRVSIAHIGGGDVTEGSYDDAMRDCISRMATIHFTTSEDAQMRLENIALLEDKEINNIHLVGSPGVDYIRSNNWKKERPIEEPYVVVSYQAETIDGTIDIVPLLESLPKDRRAVFMMPNPDAGSEQIRNAIITWKSTAKGAYVDVYEYLPHDEFLNLIYHCDEFIGNSSSMLYEAPFFDPPVKCRMIGKRQQGRVQPFGDGHACERIVDILKGEI